ncbi:MAG: restriction endonuclease [Rhizobiales bacterium]|nr:restriction endonuclease [Hyphomicrobiales bacterium]
MMRRLDQHPAKAANDILSYRDFESVYRYVHFRRSDIRQINLSLNEGLIYSLSGAYSEYNVFSRYRGNLDKLRSLLYRTHPDMRRNGWAKVHCPVYIADKRDVPFHIQLKESRLDDEYTRNERRIRLKSVRDIANIGPIFDIPCILDEKFSPFAPCHYCKGPLRILPAPSLPYGYAENNDDMRHGCAAARTVFECDHCGWWAIETEGHDAVENGGDGDGNDNDCDYSLVCGILRRFSVSDSDIPVTDLRKWLSTHRDAVVSVDPFVFEKLVADCLKHYYPKADIRLVGGRRDLGIDIFAIAENDEPTIIQVKRRTRLSATEGVNTVRELNGVLFREGVPRGMVITSACQFSRDAWQEIELAARNNRIWGARYKVELKSADFLFEMLDIANKNDNFSYATEHLDRYQPPQIDTISGKKTVRSRMCADGIYSLSRHSLDRVRRLAYGGADAPWTPPL